MQELFERELHTKWQVCLEFDKNILTIEHIQIEDYDYGWCIEQVVQQTV